MRPLILLLFLAAALPAEDVCIKAKADIRLDELIQMLGQATGQTYLYAPDGLEGRTLGGSYDFQVPRERLDDAADFLVRQCGLEVRSYPPVKVVLPTNALEAKFRATGLDTEIVFNRVPTGWRSGEDAAGSLSGKTVEALLAEAAKGHAGALDVLAATGPRGPPTIDAVAALLKDPALRAKAASTLAAYGFFAKPALPALREAAKTDPALGPSVLAVESAKHPALLDPARATDTAPVRYVVRFETTAGDFDVEVTRDWAPLAADRFYNLVRIGYFDGCRFFRVVPGFVAQFGKSGDPEVNKRWWQSTFKDEPPKESNKRGYLSFAKGGADSRSTQVFVNLKDNAGTLDKQGFAPFGRVTRGMEVLDKLYSGYGDTPEQGQIHFQGESYLRANFPKLDTIQSATIVE